MAAAVIRTTSTHPLAGVAGIAIILFCAAGIAAILGWIPTSGGGTRESELFADKENSAQKTAKPATTAKTKTSPAQVASSAPVAKCSNCGVIESVRENAAKGEGSGLGAAGGADAGNEIGKRVKTTKSYDITVRLDDGSMRLINEVNAPSWRSGDRIKIVDGTIRAI